MRDNEFGHLSLNVVQQAQIRELRGRFDAIMRRIEDFAVTSRERSMARTRLQEASMWANRAIAISETPVEKVVAEMHFAGWGVEYGWRCPLCGMGARGAYDMETHVHQCPKHHGGCGDYYIVETPDGDSRTDV